MKVRLVEFEMNAEEIKANNSIGQNIVCLINDMLCPTCTADRYDEEGDEDEQADSNRD